MSRHNPRRAAYDIRPPILVSNITGTVLGAPTEDPDPMPIIRFASVTLHKTVPRLDAGKGQATQETTFFDEAKAGVTIAYDSATGLVRLSKGDQAVYIPREGVQRFGPTLEDAALEAKARAAIAEQARIANAKAVAEAEAIAAQPA